MAFVSTNLKRAIAAGALGALLSTTALAQTTLRVVQHGNLTILDPVWTTAYVTRNHGYLIYDTLFATDAKFEIKPQMVDTWKVSDDKLTWTFTLRDGLEWHDGKPVTAEDCIASLKRWGKRDVMGTKLMDFVKEFKAVDAKTFQMIMKEPYGLVLDTLGKPSSNTPFMMPKRIAETDPFQQFKEYVGSGPFIYQAAESKPGEKHVYLRNPKYKPRAEPASGLAGGKVAKVDRVELVEMPDTQVQVNALLAGEIDIIEAPPHDLLPVLTADKNVVLEDWNPLGHVFVIRFNHKVKPFDNPKVRLAALYAINQEDYLKATIGNSKYYKVCGAAFICGTPFGTEKGSEILIKSDFEKSKALLKEAGYDGTPVVLMQSTTLPVLTNTAPVTKSLLERGGFKVDMQSMDWQTLGARRAKMDPPDKGGWNVFHTYSVSADAVNPISNAYFAATGDGKSWFGWPNDPEMEKLRDSFARETDAVKQKALAEKVQLRALETAQFGWIGQWYGPGARRANVTGWLAAPIPVFWNIEKKGK